jgi:hypothetical protein
MPTDPTVRNARVTSVTWQSESSALKAIRTAVFIEEQGVPVADEWDPRAKYREWPCCTFIAVRASVKR